MALAIAFILGLFALAFVLYPLVRRSRSEDASSEPSVPSQSQEQIAAGHEDALELIEREQSARAAIQEVELDYQLGNIDEPDYRSLRERYMRRALTALKSRYEREEEIDDEIEEQLQKLKESYEKTKQG
ncbi:hypothetical protein [Dictyobacter arantiisoli]|uniref:C-type cytochrome biogenesis protein CcmI n=1 Tax=Dictyobacter arantiisoli TaxID=2014874 RepID=A0A5A5TA75_9CHLR|nr:hypothetical protein [Dictyobacter arantiisoli]GCF08322.1 hypothetical protein KDI_18860 [Dictyobacter arantiisoli]